MVMARHTESESNSSCAQDTKAEYLVTPLHTRMKLKISRPPVFYLHVLLPLLTKVSTYAIWSSRSTNQSRGWGMSDQSGPSISLVSWQQQASVLERIATKRWFFSCSHFLVRRTLICLTFVTSVNLTRFWLWIDNNLSICASSSVWSVLLQTQSLFQNATYQVYTFPKTIYMLPKKNRIFKQRLAHF